MIRSYSLININEAGPWTGSSLVCNHKPAFSSIYPRNSGPHISSLILMRQVRGQEVHWYLILNQLFFKIYEILLDYDKQEEVAGFHPTTESNLRTALGVEICKLSHILSPTFRNRIRDGYL